MSGISDQLLAVSVLLYTFAMLGYAIEYAFGQRGAVSRIAGREAVLVGAGGASDPMPSPGESVTSPGDAETSLSDSRAALGGRIAVWLTAAGAAAHAGVLITRALAAGRVPVGNMYEFVTTVCLVGTLAWLGLVIRRPALRHLGLFASLATVILLGLAGMVLYTEVSPLVPALNSYWLGIHVTAAATASGVFMVGFVVAAMYLLRQRYEAKLEAFDGPESEMIVAFPVSLGARLPKSQTLEQVGFRLHVFAFPIWTFAVICGAIWAEAAWGRYWGWDPKETWAFISWVVYAGYLHARATPSVRRPVTAWIAVLGWVTMMVNLFGVNLVISGLHSYAGV
ncbi:MAG: c-type cytochrome biogenesis protein CcsB [Longispora sp.]|nr:c-type cytochrome biogenesis protein CcsB [Longispora sp. (in: high G+C Gram-positive bacteria)]